MDSRKLARRMGLGHGLHWTIESGLHRVLSLRANCNLVLRCGYTLACYNAPVGTLFSHTHRHRYTKQGVTWWWDTTDYSSSPDLSLLLLQCSFYLGALLFPAFFSKAYERHCSQTIWVCTVAPPLTVMGSHLISLCLGFGFYKIGIVVVLMSKVFLRIKADHTYKVLRLVQST